MAHHCHAAECKATVPPEMLMCRKHWFMVPAKLRSLVWTTYRHGQCDDWEISHAYAEAATAAVRAVAVRERRSEAEIEKAIKVYKFLDPERA
jgi:hypothetical protein